MYVCESVFVFFSVKYITTIFIPEFAMKQKNH